MNNEMESTIKELHRVGDIFHRKSELQYSLYELADSKNVKNREEENETESLNATFAHKMECYQYGLARNLPPRPQIGAAVEDPIPQDTPKDPMFSALVGVVFHASIALWLISIVLHTKSLEYFFQSVMLISGVWWFIRARNDITEYSEWKKKCAAWNVAANRFVSDGQDKKFYPQCMVYEDAFIAFAKDCDAYCEEQKEKKIRDEEALHQKFSEERKELTEKEKELKKQLETVEEQLKAVTIIHPDMTDMASDIARILEMGRADTLKEAINLAIEDDRKATEEMNRQAEAQRQEAILEQQAQEARRHQMEMEEAERAHNKAMEEETRRSNAAMEREARAHNEAMHRAAQESNRIAEDRNRHAREQSRASARQNEFTASDGHRCQKCKNRFGCRRDIHNCGAFVSER